jgi:dTDP-4-dehydrorhamnose 3,5-epimerase-like enzyme
MKLEPLEKHEDYRGLLVEAYEFPNDGQVFYVIVNPEEMRGGHYHLRKTETFLVIYGSAVITVKNRDTGDIIKAEVSGSKPMRVTVTPNHTHMLTATKEGCIFMVWADEIYDEKDNDTYMEEI